MADLTVEELEAFDKKVEDLKESFKDAEYVKKYGDALKGLFATLETEGLEKATEAFDKLALSMELGLPSAEKFGKALERSIKTFTGVTDASNTLVGSFFKLASESDDLSAVTDKMKETFRDTFSTLNIGTSIVRKIGESTLAMAKANEVATAAFNKSTGAAGAYDRELVALQQSNIANGISTAEMGESYSALMGNLSGFGVMAQSERMRLGELGAQFAKVGVSGADFAGTLQTMTRGFGMSTRAATGMQEEAMELAQTLGKDVGQVMSELNAALPQLASYGDDAVDMFFDLEKQAQRTGLAVGDLIGIAGNYRTFDSAATAAGNLNAVLGTQLFSTMGLLESQLEGPEAVIEYMSGALSDSIGDWDSLNTFQKEAVANAAGMNMEQMNHLMNQKNMTAEENARAESLDESMKAGRDLWQELTIFAQNFAIAVTPIVDGLVVGFQFINAGISQASETLGPFVNLLKLGATYWAAMIAIGGIKRMLAQMKLLTAAQWLWNAAKVTAISLSGPIGWGLLAGAAVAAGVATGVMIKNKNKHQDGTDEINPDGEPILVGEKGPELLVAPPHSAVVNNTTMTALAEQGAGGGGNNAQVVAAVRALGAKMDTMITKLGSSGDFVMQVDRQEFGRVINQHLGEEGSAPIRLKLA